MILIAKTTSNADIPARKLKLNRNKCHFRGARVPFSGEILSRDRVQPDTKKLCAPTELQSPNNKQELESFLV